MKENKLEKQLVIDIKGDKFTFDIANLTVDKYIFIESEKERISGGQYTSLITNRNNLSAQAASLMDMTILFRAFAPEVEGILSTKDFGKLSLFDSKILFKIYEEKISPWYYGWLKEFSSPLDGENEGED